ncbi:MAG: EscU/YscU/HrcU family type III secretion system export apparatus switch protein [Flavonifractor plautii]
MSKQEIKEEYKQIEGDPQIKGKIKESQRKMAQSAYDAAGAKGGCGYPKPHAFRGGAALPAGDRTARPLCWRRDRTNWPARIVRTRRGASGGRC